MANTLHALDYLEAPDKHPAAAFCVAFGDEGFLKHEVLSALQRDVLGEDDGEFSLSVFAGKDSEWTDVVDALSTVALFGPARRMGLIEEADPFVTRNRERLEDYLAKPAPMGVLVLDVKSWPGNTRLAKQAAKCGTVIDCRCPTRGGKSGAPDERRIAAWLRRRAKEHHGVDIATAAAETLLQMVEPEFGLLDQELAKLAPIVGPSGTISVELVAETVGGWRTRKTWDMIDAAVDGNAADALSQLDRLILAGEEPIALLGQMASTLRRFAVATRLIKDHERDGRRANLKEALKQAGAPHFFLEKSQRQLRQLGRQRAGQLFAWLLEADLAMKGASSSKPMARLVLEKLIVRMSATTSGRLAAGRR